MHPICTQTFNCKMNYKNKDKGTLLALKTLYMLLDQDLTLKEPQINSTKITISSYQKYEKCINK
jgi:hypothetical protein